MDCLPRMLLVLRHLTREKHSTLSGMQKGMELTVSYNSLARHSSLVCAAFHIETSLGAFNLSENRQLIKAGLCKIQFPYLLAKNK
jgi:hypothetical protein